MLPRIIIFGAANTGKKAFQMLKKQYKIAAFADNDQSKCGKRLFDIPVILPRQIISFDVEFIVVASIYHVEIARQLNEIGIKNVKLFHLSADERSYMLLNLSGELPFRNCYRRKMDSNFCINTNKNLKKRNVEGKKKVLVIAYHFPPLGGSPIQRTLKFVKYLREYGYEPIVLTTVPDGFLHYDKMDFSQLSEIPKDIQIIRIKDDFAWPDIVSEEKAQELIEFLYQVTDSAQWMESFQEAQETQPAYILPDRLILWANACVRHIEEYVDMQDIDLLYSTVPEWSPHLVAYYFKQKYGIKWIADYRDPWVSNEAYVSLYYPRMTKEEIALDRELEKKIVGEMDSIIIAGGKWAEDFVKNYHVDQRKIKEITNGYDETDFIDLDIKTKKNVKFTLCHNGIINYNRNPIPVIQAINSLIDQNEIGSNEVQWVFNGWISGAYLRRMLEEDRYHIIVQNGVLPHKESIQVGMQADVMVMYGESGENGALNYPSKFYEYLRIGRPIMCFSSADSFQESVLREIGEGVNLNLYDLEGIKDYLRTQFKIWRTGSGSKTNINRIVQKYERRNLTRMLAEQFDRVLCGTQ